MDTIPAEKQVLDYFRSLSNLGRWGKEDMPGTLNFLNEKKKKGAVSLVEDVVTVSCARPISFQESLDSTTSVVRYMVESGDDGQQEMMANNG
tara:strand:- start:256 stop:531 length:276 start_codon:yes stop_codon:yes gene_type:complete